MNVPATVIVDPLEKVFHAHDLHPVVDKEDLDLARINLDAEATVEKKDPRVQVNHLEDQETVKTECVKEEELHLLITQGPVQRVRTKIGTKNQSDLNIRRDVAAHRLKNANNETKFNVTSVTIQVKNAIDLQNVSAVEMIAMPV